jgi:hypothetical protein
MKKYILAGLAVLVVAGAVLVTTMSFAKTATPPPDTDTVPSITVTSPIGGTNFTAGQVVTVRWTSIGIASVQPLRLGLFSNTSGSAELTGTNVVNSAGQGTLTIPSTAVTGQYVFKVYLPPVYGVSSPVNVVATSPKVPTITITSPSGGENYTAGQSVTVKWTSTQISSTQPLRLGLFSNTSGSAELTGTNVVNSAGQGTLTIPSTAVTGQYVFKVYLPPVYGVSNSFNVTVSS